MFKLIINEFSKIFHKKSIYVMLIIFILFVFFTNLIYKNDISIIENDRLILMNFFNEYEMLIIIFIVVIGTSIICDEFKGTIKQLLIVPYKRYTILISKYITTFIMFIFIFVFLLIIQLIIGYLFFNYSLNIPITINNESMNVFKYLFTMLLNKLPMFILTIMLVYLLSILTCNGVLSIVISLLNNLIIVPIINVFTLYNYTDKLSYLSYLMSPNWDLNIYLYGNSIVNPILNYNYSLLICIEYFVILLITSILIFEKKDIKNI